MNKKAHDLVKLGNLSVAAAILRVHAEHDDVYNEAQLNALAAAAGAVGIIYTQKYDELEAQLANPYRN